MSKSKTYTIDTTCSNCDYVGKAILPRKQKVSDVLPKTECPFCGCETLSKKNKLTKTQPFLTNPSPNTIPCNLPHFVPAKKKRKSIPPMFPQNPTWPRERAPWESPVWCGIDKTSDDRNRIRTSTTLSSKGHQQMVNQPMMLVN